MEQRKLEIIEAASGCFSEKGYTATSVNDICKAAGIAKGGFYWHFTSKKEALREVLNHSCQAQAALWDQLEQIEIMPDQIIQAGWSFIEASLSNPAKFKLFDILEREALNDPGLIELYKENQRGLRNQLLRFSQRILEGYPAISMESQNLADLLLITVNGLVRQEVFGLIKMDIRQMWEGFVHCLLSE